MLLLRTLLFRTLLLRMLLLRVASYLTSVLRYKFLISDSYHPNILYLRKQQCEDSRLFFEAKRGPQTKESEKPCFRVNRG